MQNSQLPEPIFRPFPSDGSGYDTDVVVVGLGPAGGVAALALASYGVRVHAVSIFPWVANSPRAHITNQRAAEVLRDLGVEDEARRYATPWDQMGDTLFTTSLAGEEIVRLQTWGTGDPRFGDYLAGSPCAMLDIPQPLMEPVLIKNAAEHGAIISFHTEYLHHTQDGDGVTVRFRDVRSGSVFTQRARYLLGFDGARSKIAEQLQLPFKGELARAGTAYIRFDADLSKYVAHRPSILHWIMNSKAGFGEIGMGLLRAIRPWDQWIAGWGFDMAAGEPDVSDATVIERIRTLVGDPELELDIVSRSFWYVNQQYAEHYQDRRVFCGGDAVHRHPPSSGLGSNTSMQDAFNLAWKVAFVVKGHAGTALLDSYSPERVPVGQQIVARANQSRKDYAGLREWFDADSDDPVAAGLSKLKEGTPEGVALRDRLYEALELKNTEFNAHGVELNQRYESGAVVEADEPERWARDKQLYLQATTRPGAKLPHAWLVGRDGVRTSTLDVTGKGMMTLLTGLGGQAWKNAAENLDLPYLRTVVIGEPGAADPYGYWRAVSEIHEAGAILVRPDGYVAWRHQGPVWDDAEASSALDAALDAVLAVSTARTASGEDAGAPQFSTAQVPITVPQAAPDTEPALAGVETGRNQS
ncbi:MULTISPECIES: FAD-dependent monooxygenase [unclassified Rhodococcus (in: high G+C Gram-positive bacteria)]|uniref:FAD-dependent monooxygenase n=1 Tax=unclassified Rhodococcus (in: high G+C Gram-positive bacteria) TaxID=192944 RepID=UPI0006F6344C|nr:MULTISPECIES: FAD-dependent monooxygenase [unclassified Rhodococcus (in: high G+C Gram-positive bacteria)]KQU29398.1 2,4-dichlorophenol 6-monooxygenase [Rhodococcus sp. Leaf225]KQU41139.1 2,4-dichlorophenol 6-monooxygenase [Rhodococcus sp. Leaf258]